MQTALAGRRCAAPPRTARGGFTLVELLVVIGIIALLIAILLPALSRARGQANTIKCASQMRDIGVQLNMYAMENKGCLVPLKYVGGTQYVKHRGGDETYSERWPMVVFKPPPDAGADGKYIAKIMVCPSDNDPKGEHSYNINAVFFPVASTDISRKAIRLGSRIKYFSASEAVYLVDKWPQQSEWHLDVAWSDAALTTWNVGTCTTQWDKLVFNVVNAGDKKQYKHGKMGNNYLYLDFSVRNDEPRDPRLQPIGSGDMCAPHTYIAGS